jgi:peroxiredoxin
VLRIAEWSLLASRLLLAAVFFLAGTGKLIDPAGWRRTLRDFSLPSAFARPMMVLLPVLELAVAAALIPASLAWYGARGALALLAAFMIAVGIAMIRGRKPDCHCFGQLHSTPVGWPTLIRNAFLALCAAWLVLRGERPLGPDLWAWYFTLGVEGRKVAVVAACAVGFFFIRLLLGSRSRPETTPIEPQLAAAADDNEEDQPRPAAPPKPRTAPAPQPPDPVRRNALGIGLPIGTPAPEFELPGMNGEKRSSQSLRKQGRDVLLVFSSPFCKPCEMMPSNLVRWAREMQQFPNIVLISKGTAKDNRPKLKEFGTAQVLLQRESEVAEMYDCVSTPSAVLVGADGLIRSELVNGGPAIKQLLSAWRSSASSAKHPIGSAATSL